MTFDRIKKIIVEHFGLDETRLTLDADLVDELEADSLDLFQFMSEVEDEFNIKIDELDNIKTLRDVVYLVDSKLGE